METAEFGFGSFGYDLTMNASGDEFEELTPEELLNRMKSAESVTDGAYTVGYHRYSSIKTEHLTAEGIEFLDRNQSQAYWLRSSGNLFLLPFGFPSVILARAII